MVFGRFASHTPEIFTDYVPITLIFIYVILTLVIDIVQFGEEIYFQGVLLGIFLWQAWDFWGIIGFELYIYSLLLIMTEQHFSVKERFYDGEID